MDSKLIVIEGLDGSGKATQSKKLYDFIVSSGQKAKFITFPDYESNSSALVKMYLNGELGSSAADVNAYAASSFYAVDRFASFKKDWGHDYLSGTTIIADRYTTSNAIYQLAKLPNKEWDDFLNWLEDYEYNRLKIPKPNIVIYLDMEPEISQHLLSGRYHGDETKKDLHEKDLEFLKSCRTSALYAADKLNWHVIRCYKDNSPISIDEISENIKDVLNNL
ncbi:MAG: deoxynucleoside kinase [Bacillota bacterium]|nr:deoxynucleoside kinase [Bacillota bacterium]